MRLQLLSGFRLTDDGRTTELAPAEQRLIALLAVTGPRNRSELTGLLWPDGDERRGQARLRSSLWRLRSKHPALLDGADTLWLGAAVTVDTATFEAAARDALAVGSALPPIAALDGPYELLPGWYDDWVIFERERLRQLQLHALEALADRLRAGRRHREAGEAALAAVQLDPLRESATRVLMMVHLAEHNAVEAIRRYRIFRDHLADELGIAPSAELARLLPARIGGPSARADDEVATRR